MFIPSIAWSKKGKAMVSTVRVALCGWDPLDSNSQDVVWGLSIG